MKFKKILIKLSLFSFVVALPLMSSAQTSALTIDLPFMPPISTNQTPSAPVTPINPSTPTSAPVNITPVPLPTTILESAPSSTPSSSAPSSTPRTNTATPNSGASPANRLSQIIATPAAIEQTVQPTSGSGEFEMQSLASVGKTDYSYKSLSPFTTSVLQTAAVTAMTAGLLALSLSGYVLKNKEATRLVKVAQTA